jgi:hypothetical protein
MKSQSIFKIKLVRSLSYLIALKIIGFVILFIFFFSPSHRPDIKVEDIITDVYLIENVNRDKNKE